MAKLTLTNVASGVASTTVMNNNNDLIEAAIENTLSRDGTSPNTMGAPLDMNSNRIINLPQPVDDNDAARLADVNIVIATGLPDQTGHSGKVLTTDGVDASWGNMDATLVALAALNATAGLVEQIGADTFTKRAIGVASATDIPTRSDADSRYKLASTFTEDVQDVVGAFATDGTTIDMTYNDGAGTLVAELQTTYNPVGKHLIPLPAASWSPTTTNGCGPITQAETATNKVNYKYLPFDGAAIEYATLSFPAPKSWNESTVTFRFRSQAASSSGDVIWGIAGLALGDGDTLDTAYGTAVEVTDNHPNATTQRVSSETSAMTLAGSPAEGDTIFLRVYRKATDAGDTLNAVDAWLIQVDMFLTTNAATDA